MMRRTFLALLGVATILTGSPVASTEAMPPGIADPDKAIQDWRYRDPVFFWRLTSVPDNPFEPEPYFYWPEAVVEGEPKPFVPHALQGEETISPAALERITVWATSHKTNSLIIIHEGKVQLEEYWNDTPADELLNGRALTRSVTPMALGFAVADGALSLSDPIGQYITEWKSDLRGQITVRQLGQNASGLEVAPRLPTTQILGNKDLCLVYCGDVVRAALAYDYVSAPGERFEVAQENMQLLALVIERATRQSIRDIVSDRIWKPMGGSDATFQFDRPGGTIRTMCCMRATARDWTRLGMLLVDDGKWSGKQVLPEGWTKTLSTASPTNPNFGLGLWLGTPYVQNRSYFEGQPGLVYQSEPFLADDVMFMEGGGFRLVYAVPSEQLVIFRHGETVPDWDASLLVNMALRGIDQGKNQ